MISKIKEAGLKISPNKQKCTLFQEKVKFLGHVVSKEGISTDPGKISAVFNWPKPHSVREVRNF